MTVYLRYRKEALQEEEGHFDKKGLLKDFVEREYPLSEDEKDSLKIMVFQEVVRKSMVSPLIKTCVYDYLHSIRTEKYDSVDVLYDLYHSLLSKISWVTEILQFEIAHFTFYRWEEVTHTILFTEKSFQYLFSQVMFEKCDLLELLTSNDYSQKYHWFISSAWNAFGDDFLSIYVKAICLRLRAPHDDDLHKYVNYFEDLYEKEIAFAFHLNLPSDFVHDLSSMIEKKIICELPVLDGEMMFSLIDNKHALFLKWYHSSQHFVESLHDFICYLKDKDMIMVTDVMKKFGYIHQMNTWCDKSILKQCMNGLLDTPSFHKRFFRIHTTDWSFWIPFLQSIFKFEDLIPKIKLMFWTFHVHRFENKIENFPLTDSLHVLSPYTKSIHRPLSNLHHFTILPLGYMDSTPFFIQIHQVPVQSDLIDLEKKYRPPNQRWYWKLEECSIIGKLFMGNGLSCMLQMVFPQLIILQKLLKHPHTLSDLHQDLGWDIHIIQSILISMDSILHKSDHMQFSLLPTLKAVKKNMIRQLPLPNYSSFVALRKNEAIQKEDQFIIEARIVNYMKKQKTCALSTLLKHLDFTKDKTMPIIQRLIEKEYLSLTREEDLNYCD